MGTASGYLDVHQRRVLLAAVPVGVAQVALGRGARSLSLDGEGGVAIEEFNLLGRHPIRRGNRFAANIIYRLCMSFFR